MKGFEQAPEDEGHIQASACCKHYAANSMEHTTEGGQTHTRHDFSATITQQDLVDSYLLPFQSCVEKGKVSGLMCSYNSINGVRLYLWFRRSRKVVTDPVAYTNFVFAGTIMRIPLVADRRCPRRLGLRWVHHF